MNRNLRSNRAKKESILTKDQIILCFIDGEHKLFKIIEDWKNGEEQIKVNELVAVDNKKRNKQQYRCLGKSEINKTTQFIEVDGVSVIKLDEEIYVIDQEIYQQAIRGLLKEQKSKLELTHKSLDNEDSISAPVKKQNRTMKKQQPASELSSPSSDSSVSEEEAEPVPKKQRQSGKQENKTQNKGKKKGNSQTISKIEIPTICKQQQDPNDDFIDYQSSRMNNKEVIRAAMTGNKKLMENIFQSQKKVSNLEDRWGLENDISALEILLKRQDKELLIYFLENKNQVQLCSDLACQLKEIHTGYNNKYAYGVKLRKVTLGRGCREGNNAFIYDQNDEDLYGYYKIRRLLEIETDPQLFEQFLIHQRDYEHNFLKYISCAVRSGNIKTAQYFISYSLTTNQNGYGFNYLHCDAFGDNFSTYNIEQIKKQSITKWTSGDFVMTPIHCACINPSDQFLRYFMEQTMEFNITDENNRKPVHYAAVSQTSACLEFLLQNGIDAREGDSFLHTPLMLASKYGRAHNVKLLCNTNCKAKNKEGDSAIHLASQNGHLQCVKLLLQQGVLINFTGKSKMTPLHLACAYNHLELVEFLLDEGARINAKDKFGRTPLIMAAKNGNLVILSKLLHYGADFTISDSSKNTAIHYAGAYGFLESLEQLIEAGANQNEYNSWKLKPLNVAMAKNHFSLVKALLKYENTDVNCIDDDGLTLVAGMIKNFNQNEQQFNFINYLIKDKKADINIADKYGKTCLSHAIGLGESQMQQDLIKLLIQQGADINAREKDGYSPLLFSLYKENYSLANMLLKENNPNINIISCSDKSAIHILIENVFFFEDSGIDLFNYLIERIDPNLLNVPDADGFVPILRLVQVFINNIHQRMNENLQIRIMKRKWEIWENLVQQFKVDEIQDITNIQNPQPYPNQFQQAQREMQEYVNKQGQNQNAQNFSNKKGIEVRVGITLEEQQQFHNDRVQDSYLYQNRIIDILKILVQKGADPKQKIIKQKHLRENNKSFSSPFFEQSAFHFLFEKLPSVSFLQGLLTIFPKEQINQSDSVGYPLHYFIKSYLHTENILGRQDESYLSFFNYLLENGVDVLQKNSNQETPTLLIALQYNQNYSEILKKLISLGGQINDCNSSNQIPLHYFVQKQDIKTVKILLTEYHADPNFQDRDGRTALHYAINFSNSNANASFQMELFLIRSGAKCDKKDKYDRTPLFYAFTKFYDPQGLSEIDPFETVSSLLANKECDVNCLDRYMRSPLHYAALRGSAISGRYMIKMGAKVDQLDILNNTPMTYAFFKHANFSTMLIDNKADVNKSMNIYSLQDFKAEKQARYLLELRNDPEIDRLMELEEQEQMEQQKHRDEKDKQKENSDKESEDEENDSNEEEEDEDEDDEDEEVDEERRNNRIRELEVTKQNDIEKSKLEIKEQIIQKKLNEKMVKDIDIPQLLHNNMSTGSYSYFSQAIKFGWQGVAYLLISDGYQVVKAIEDAIRANQFQLVLTLLMKVKNEEDLQLLNQFGQNLFHLFAINSLSVHRDMKNEIIEELELKNVSPYLQDQYYRLPLHYATEKNDEQLISYFLYNRNCDSNLMDYTNNNAFTISLQLSFNVQLFCNLTNLNWDVKFQIENSKVYMKPFLYLIQHKMVNDQNILGKFIEHGVDVNEKNDKDQTAITFAIQNNDINLLKFILEQPTFQKEMHSLDKDGKNPIHHVVLPLEFGSYENLDMLQILLQIFDCNIQDNKGLTPLDYALIFDAQIMKEELLRRNAAHTRSLRQQRMPTSIIATELWPEQEINFEQDAQQYQEQYNQKIEIEIDNRKIVDRSARIAKADLSVYEDPEYGMFQCLLSKVDIVNKNFHKNVFYKMQLLYDHNRNNYILFTKWGKIGTDGQFQLTPFENLEQTMKEYCKIFQQKTGGNDWKLIKRGEHEFEQRPGKYQLIKLSNNVNHQSILKPFDFSSKSTYPQCQLNESIQNIIKQFSQVKLYQQELRTYSFDMEFIPLEKLDKNMIMKAKEILLELYVIVKDINEYRKNTDIDLKKLQQFYAQINNKSARFYEIIPQTELRQNMLPLLESSWEIDKKLELIELLLNVEFSVKILLGASLKLNVLNPLTYCFNALNIKMLTLSREDLEFKMIETYVRKTKNIQIENVFAIERKGEDQQFEQHKSGKRILLWHGSKISNFMSLLAMGLKIAPTWAVNTGALYGKGIYFADQFSKSYSYTTDNTINYQQGAQDFNQFRYLLLCEVSASNQVDVYRDSPVDLASLIKPDATIKVVGSQGPNELSQIKMPNSCIVPIGNIIAQTIPDKLKSISNQISFQTSQTEYIVYNETKVRLRYLVQVR